MSKKCICEICTCGRHKCPHQPTALYGKGQPCTLQSEYKKTYQEKPLAPRESFKPTQQALGGGAQETDTTQRVDYVRHPMEKPFVHQKDEYRRPDGDFDMVTSYTKEYTEKYGTPAKAIRNEGQRQVPQQFEGEPTYKSDYRKWDIPRQGPIHNQEQWNPPQHPFEGQSTQKADYRQYQQPPRSSFRPREAAKQSDSPFADNTDYRDSYTQHELQPKYVREQEKYNSPAVPFGGKSTHQKDYQGAPGSRGQSFKPDNQAHQSNEPSEKETTNRRDYVKWQVPRPQFHQQGAYEKPEGDMDMNTTHKIQFTEHPLQKSVAVRPHSAAKARNAEFEGTTTNMRDYVAWKTGQTQRAGPKNDYAPNQAPFEGLSTHKAHYIQHAMQPSKSFRPDNAPIRSDEAFNGATNYRHDYTPKKIEVCPATIIENPNTSGYRFLEMDNRGHKQYQPVYESIQALPRSQVRSPQKLQALSVS